MMELSAAMPQAQVDYDHIAASYDRRFAHGGLTGPASALSELARDLGAERILEVGCGTGHWLESLEGISGQLYGLDLSAAMLGQAQRRDRGFHLARGRAGQLPFPDDSFDLVFCVNAIHHFQQQRRFVTEAKRLLRSGGALAVVGMDPRSDLGQWYIYDYFEGTYETDLVRFPSWGTILEWMAAAGFEQVQWQLVEQILDNKLGRAVLDDPFIQKDACSQLSLLTNEAYATGLRRIEAAIQAAEAGGETLSFPTDLFLAMLVGRVRGKAPVPARNP
jgi:ubiquinone/menaquinone biosynthesis C-methylase UbiE